MSNRFDNKKLLYILAGLIALLALTLLVKIPKENATLKNLIAEVDTSAVYKIIIHPKQNKNQPFEFIKENGRWMVQQGEIKSATREGAIQNILTSATNLKPESLASSDKSKWGDYELTDSLASSVQFLNKKGKIISDMLIGKFSYKQLNDPYGGYGGYGNNIKGTSYIRLQDEKEVYAVDGFVSLAFAGNFDDWRDKSFIRAEKENITSLQFVYPADSSFILRKEGKIWNMAGQPADSTLVDNYLNSIVRLEGQSFKNNFKPVTSPFCQLKIEGNNLTNITVKCYQGDTADEFVLNSSLNQDVYYTSDKSGIYETLFKSKKSFVK